MKVEVVVPEEYLGDVMGDLNHVVVYWISSAAGKIY